jgi:type VI secretion system ImpA/VasJ family protein
MAKPKSDEESGRLWREILDHAVNLLRDVSKDILVFNYASVAMLMNYGVRGLAETLRVFHSYLDEHYEEMSPKKPKFQANAFGWLGLFLEYQFAVMGREMTENGMVSMTDEEAEAWISLPELFQDIFDCVNEHIDQSVELDKKFMGLPDMVKDFADLAAAELKRREEAKAAKADEEKAAAEEPPPPPAPEKESPPPPPPKPATAPPPPPPPPKPAFKPAAVKADVPELPEGEEVDRNAVIGVLKKSISLLLKGDPQDPLAYGLNRIMVWSAVKTLPGRQTAKGQEHKTFLQKPPDTTFVLTNVKNEAAGKLAQLEPIVMAFEAQLAKPGMAFWLDLQRIQAMFLEKLGWDAARRMVASETLAFVNRMGDELLALCYSDGTPFADDDTVKWIQSLRGTASKPRSAPVVAAKPPAAGPVTVAVKATPSPAVTVDDIGSGMSLEEILSALQNESSLYRRWLLVVEAGKRLAAGENTVVTALAVLQSCRKRAEEIRLKEAAAGQYVDIMVLIRRLQEALSGGRSVLDLNTAYAAYVHEALWLDPAAFLSGEIS